MCVSVCMGVYTCCVCMGMHNVCVCVCVCVQQWLFSNVSVSNYEQMHHVGLLCMQ